MSTQPAPTTIDDSDLTLISLEQVMAMTSLKRAFIYQLQKQGRFPKAIPLAGSRVAWRRSEVAAWIQQRIETGKAA
jgi:prophage regulatory protein